MSPILPKDLLPGESDQEKIMSRVLKITFDTYKRPNIDASRGGWNRIIASQTVESSDSESGKDCVRPLRRIDLVPWYSGGSKYLLMRRR